MLDSMPWTRVVGVTGAAGWNNHNHCPPTIEFIRKRTTIKETNKPHNANA